MRRIERFLPELKESDENHYPLLISEKASGVTRLSRRNPIVSLFSAFAEAKKFARSKLNVPDIHPISEIRKAKHDLFVRLSKKSGVFTNGQTNLFNQASICYTRAMKYQLSSMTFSADDSARLEFNQVEDEINLEFPLMVMIEGFIKEAKFLDTLVLMDFFEIEFVKAEVYSINNKPLTDILNYQKKFKIELGYRQLKDPFDYAPFADNPDSDRILDAEIIE